ncbi:MAG: response regulator [Treponema sp.]|nr:response regulator [Treponema sp.]
MASITGEKKRILVVDDDATQLEFVEVILKDEYDVVTVTSGQGALEHLSQDFAPSLILLDVLMPEMGGFETFDKMQATGHIRNVPVIFLTSVNSPEEIRRALELGAIDYITKPYAMENFTNRVRNAIKVYEHKRR